MCPFLSQFVRISLTQETFSKKEGSLAKNLRKYSEVELGKETLAHKWPLMDKFTVTETLNYGRKIWSKGKETERKIEKPNRKQIQRSEFVTSFVGFKSWTTKNFAITYVLICKHSGTGEVNEKKLERMARDLPIKLTFRYLPKVRRIFGSQEIPGLFLE